MKQGRVMKNTEGAIRAIDEGNGICRLQKDIDVLEIVPVRNKKSPELITLGALALFIGLAVALILFSPAFGTIFFAVIAWTMFAAFATGEEDG